MAHAATVPAPAAPLEAGLVTDLRELRARIAACDAAIDRARARRRRLRAAERAHTNPWLRECRHRLKKGPAEASELLEHLDGCVDLPRFAADGPTHTRQKRLYMVLHGQRMLFKKTKQGWVRR